MMFSIIETPIKDLIIIKNPYYIDDRGIFEEIYTKKEFLKFGIDLDFVQDNHSFSKKGVLRGLHFQLEHTQGKFINVIYGKIFDVAVDLRPNSPSFGKWFGIELSDENKLKLYIPPKFAHGFLAITETHLVYKCTDYYFPEFDCGIIWNDEEINIKWPINMVNEVILSKKDSNLPKFKEIKRLIFETWK